jgi:hypothetical protein
VLRIICTFESKLPCSNIKSAGSINRRNNPNKNSRAWHPALSTTNSKDTSYKSNLNNSIRKDSILSRSAPYRILKDYMKCKKGSYNLCIVSVIALQTIRWRIKKDSCHVKLIREYGNKKTASVIYDQSSNDYFKKIFEYSEFKKILELSARVIGYLNIIEYFKKGIRIFKKKKIYKYSKYCHLVLPSVYILKSSRNFYLKKWYSITLFEYFKKSNR